MAAAVLGAGLFAFGCSESGTGADLSFTVKNSGSPAEPQILIPGETSKLKMEIFQEPSVTGKEVTFSDSADNSDDASDSPSSDSDSDDVSSADNSEDGDTEESASAAPQGKGFGSGSDDKSKITKTYYSTTVDYGGSGEPVLEIDGVEQGEWILRITALDKSGETLAYHQEGFNVGRSNANIKGWLQPGKAPEGYLYASRTSDGSISRVSLYSGLVDKYKLTTGSPAYLFAKRTEIPGIADTLYATTGGRFILKIVPDLVKITADIDELGFVQNGLFVRSDTDTDYAAVSFYKDGLVRFFDFSGDSSDFDYAYTGKGAGYISHLTAKNYAWVCNGESDDMTLIDFKNHTKALSGNLRLGGDSPIAAEANADNSKVWVLVKGNSGSMVRVMDFSAQNLGGTEWGRFTTNMSSPGALYLCGDEWACVTDNRRGELIFLDASSRDENRNIDEIFGKSGARMKLSGGGDQIIYDGYRLYVLQSSSGRIAEIDASTKTIVQTFSLGGTSRSMMLVK